MPANGTVAEGRGGAFVARASDPTALIHNTAAIVGLAGTQVVLGTNLGFFSQCFTRTGNYPSETQASIENQGTVFANSMYARGNVAYPEVCNEPNATPGITPHILVTHRINRRIAFGLGVYGPSTTGARQVYSPTVMTSAGLAPSPVRHLLFEKDLLLFHVTLSVAYALNSWLRFGVALQPSFAKFHFSTMINPVPSAVQSPDRDLRIDLDTSGFFIAGNVSLQAIPSRYLAIAANVHVNGQAELRGTGTTTANYYAPTTDTMDTRPRGAFSIDRMSVPLPWNAQIGARFVMPRAGGRTQENFGSDGLYDPMVDDLFDIEAEFTYENTSSMGTVTLISSGNINLGSMSAPAPAESQLRSNLNNAYGFRVGGDVNVLPGRLAVRAGFAYDTGSNNPQFVSLHLPGYETTSVHGGFSLRAGPITASFAYGHFILSDINSPMGSQGITSVGGAVTPEQCATSGTGAGACQINRGVFKANFDVISVGLAARF